MTAENVAAAELTDANDARSAAEVRRCVRHHAEMLAISLAAIALSFVLHVDQTGGVELGKGGFFKLPPLCGSKILFDVDCPACGLTRAFVFLAQQHWSDALAMNRVGWVVALATIIQIPYRLVAIRRRVWHPLGVWTARLFGWGIIAALVGNWMLKLAGF